MRVLGIDVGTTAVKAAVLDPEVGVVGFGRHGYQLETPRPGRVELDAEEYLRGVAEAVRSALQSAGGAAGVSALAISSQGETLVPVDRDGLPTRPAIVWLDGRATAEAERLAELHGDRVYATTGQPLITPTWPTSKLLWLREHEPAVFASTHAFLLLEDYLVSRLTGERVASRCLYSSSLLLDISSGGWWGEMLETLGVDERRLARLVDSAEPVGMLTLEAAGKLGLKPETVVVSGGLDQVIAAWAAGMSQGVVAESTGSALAVTAEVAGAVFDPEMSLPVHLSVTPGRFCLLAWSPTAGTALEWTRTTFFPDATSFQELDEAAAAIAPAAEGLLALPQFEGTAFPDFDPSARAALVGLTLRHTRTHVARAVLEAVAFDLRTNLEPLEELSGAAAELRSIGGGARSDLWLQIKADVLQRPIVALEQPELGCVGAAALAGLGAGVWRDRDEARTAFERPRLRVEPTAANASLYDDAYRRYRQLRETLSPLFRGDSLSAAMEVPSG